MTNGIWRRIDDDLDGMRRAGQYKRLKNLMRPMGPESEIEGAGNVVVLCSNDYLGLANHPEVVTAAMELASTNFFTPRSMPYRSRW